jgi:7-dehydrocholesterol reductase
VFNGSVWQFLTELVFKEGIRGVLSRWPSITSPETVEACTWFFSFGALQAVLQLLVPGKLFFGPVSPKGNVPVYKVRDTASVLKDIDMSRFFL